MIVVTGASGKLGGLVIQRLLKSVAAEGIVAAVRSPEKAAGLKALGVQVREADYSKPATLASAFAGAEKVLLISSNEMGQRVAQHQAVIDAAVAAQVKLLIYTSLLKADSSSLSLAAEHLATEKAIRASGLPFVILRNGWYLENHTEALAPVLQYGVLLGASGDGKFRAAGRADYADAAAAVLTGEGHESKIYELAGDDGYTRAELAAAVSAAANTAVAYKDLSQEEYEKALLGAGLPEPIAAMLANSDAGAARGDLDSESTDLHSLIGRKTTPLADAVRLAVEKK